MCGMDGWMRFALSEILQLFGFQKCKTNEFKPKTTELDATEEDLWRSRKGGEGEERLSFGDLLDPKAQTEKTEKNKQPYKQRHQPSKVHFAGLERRKPWTGDSWRGFFGEMRIAQQKTKTQLTNESFLIIGARNRLCSPIDGVCGHAWEMSSTKTVLLCLVQCSLVCCGDDNGMAVGGL